MYTKEHCPYCIRAKNELQADRVSYVEKNLSDYGQKAETTVKGLVELTQCKTVPQIFICGKYVSIRRPLNSRGGPLSLRMHSFSF
ncbi:glutaredoxin [Ancylostoma caninum]|nr:glutaredoxin [Ancylostoma caninum]